MPSSPTDTAQIDPLAVDPRAAEAASATPAGWAATAAALPSETAAEISVPRRSWLKRALPETMFGRSLLLIMLPLVFVQLIAAWVFYDRLWGTVSRQLSANVAGDIEMVIKTMPLAHSGTQLNRLLRQFHAATELDVSWHRGAHLPPPGRRSGTLLEYNLRRAIEQHLDEPFRIDAVTDPYQIRVAVRLPRGVLDAVVPRGRLYTSTTYIFILWMVGSAIVLLAIATIFLRNQVKSLRRLAAAAESFGKGRSVAFAKVEGALEVRQAAIAFLQMHDRIQRQIRQRTEMLAGVSHDLRTPLTRMKLALEFLGDDASVAELKSDVAEMEQMINGYLEFARGEGSEAPVETDIGLLFEDLVASARRDGTPISLDFPDEFVMSVRPNALRRCVGNLVANARRYADHIWLSGVPAPGGIDIFIDDDGPGIPPAERERVFRPFIRLDPSRNPTTGGVGLGLTIARDVARSHGGDVRLETAPQGGLRARVHLPL